MVWCDGQFLEEGDFKVSPFDRSLCHGLSFFETILAVDGKPRLLLEHLDRLRGGLHRLGIVSVELSDTGLESVMVSLLKKNGLMSGNVRVRFSVSLGAGPINRTDGGEAWAWMTAVRAAEAPAGIRITDAPWKLNRDSVLRGLKTGNYVEHVIAMDMARREGFDEMLFYNTSNELCEAAMANVFLIHKGTLLTPSLDSGCLAGVTRRVVMKLAGSMGIPCREMPLGAKDVKKADGLFLTSSIQGPVWVSALEGRSFEISPLFLSIRQAWLEEMSRVTE